MSEYENVVQGTAKRGRKPLPAEEKQQNKVKSMNVAVIGARGATGRLAVGQLLDTPAVSKVVCFLRGALTSDMETFAASSKFEFRQGDFFGTTDGE